MNICLWPFSQFSVGHCGIAKTGITVHKILFIVVLEFPNLAAVLTNDRSEHESEGVGWHCIGILGGHDFIAYAERPITFQSCSRPVSCLVFMSMRMKSGHVLRSPLQMVTGYINFLLDVRCATDW